MNFVQLELGLLIFTLDGKGKGLIMASSNSAKLKFSRGTNFFDLKNYIFSRNKSKITSKMSIRVGESLPFTKNSRYGRVYFTTVL